MKRDPCRSRPRPSRVLLLPTYPTVDECLDRLHRAGWSVGETGSATRWQVSGTNGENAIYAEGRTQAEAWARACEQARAVGILAPPRGDEGCGRL